MPRSCVQDSFTLVLSNGGKNADRELVGIRQIRANELHTGVAQIQKERGTSREPVELRHQEHGARLPAALQGSL